MFQGGRGIDAHRTNDIRIGLLIMFHHASWYLQLLSHIIYSSFPAAFCFFKLFLCDNVLMCGVVYIAQKCFKTHDKGVVKPTIRFTTPLSLVESIYIYVYPRASSYHYSW